MPTVCGTAAPSSRSSTPLRNTSPRDPSALQSSQDEPVSPMEEDTSTQPPASHPEIQTPQMNPQLAPMNFQWNRPAMRDQDQVTRSDRVSRSRYQLVLRPLIKYNVNDIPKHTFAHIIGASAPQSYLAELASHKYDTTGNCIYINVYDETHASRLVQVGSVFFVRQGAQQSIPVEIKLSPYKPNTTRGVITIEPNESNEETLRWLRCEQAKILACHRLGRTNRAVVTFDTPTLPKAVKYYMAIIKVSPYQPKRLVCYNCHNVGHMARSCPAQAVCKACGKPHSESEECGPQIYCVACKQYGHIALNPTCPSRIPTPPASPQKDATKGVTWADRARGTQSTSITSHPTNSNSEKEPTMAAILSQLAALRADIQQLRKENQQLRSENQELKRQLDSKTMPTAASKQLPNSQTRPSRSQSTKRTPTSRPTSESPLQLALQTVRTDIHRERLARQAERKQDQENFDTQMNEIRSLVQSILQKLPSRENSKEPPRKVSIRPNNQSQ